MVFLVSYVTWILRNVDNYILKGDFPSYVSNLNISYTNLHSESVRDILCVDLHFAYWDGSLRSHTLK